MTKMLYFVVISLKANLFFFRQNVTIFFKSYHSSFTSHPKKVCCLPLFKSKKINLRICYETRFWKLPTNLSNDFERESLKLQILFAIFSSKPHNSLFCVFFLLKNFIFFQNL